MKSTSGNLGMVKGTEKEYLLKQKEVNILANLKMMNHMVVELLYTWMDQYTPVKL